MIAMTIAQIPIIGFAALNGKNELIPNTAKKTVSAIVKNIFVIRLIVK